MTETDIPDVTSYEIVPREAVVDKRHVLNPDHYPQLELDSTEPKKMVSEEDGEVVIKEAEDMEESDTVMEDMWLVVFAERGDRVRVRVDYDDGTWETSMLREDGWSNGRPEPDYIAEEAEEQFEQL